MALELTPGLMLVWECELSCYCMLFLVHSYYKVTLSYKWFNLASLCQSGLQTELVQHSCLILGHHRALGAVSEVVEPQSILYKWCPSNFFYWFKWNSWKYVVLSEDVIYAVGVSLLGLDTTQVGKLTVFWGNIISVWICKLLKPRRLLFE